MMEQISNLSTFLSEETKNRVQAIKTVSNKLTSYVYNKYKRVKHTTRCVTLARSHPESSPVHEELLVSSVIRAERIL